MKKYNEFINEEKYYYANPYITSNLKPIFVCIIDTREYSHDKKMKALEEIEYYFSFDRDYKNQLLNSNFLWCVEIYNLQEKKYLRVKSIRIYDNDNTYINHDIVTLDEFLNVGIEGLQNLIEVKKDINKYNI